MKITQKRLEIGCNQFCWSTTHFSSVFPHSILLSFYHYIYTTQSLSLSTSKHTHTHTHTHTHSIRFCQIASGWRIRDFSIFFLIPPPPCKRVECVWVKGGGLIQRKLENEKKEKRNLKFSETYKIKVPHKMTLSKETFHKVFE